MTYGQQPPLNQPQYQQQYAPPKPSNGLATAGFVVALVGAVLALIPFVGVVSWVISPVGLVLSAVGLALAFRRGAGKGLAIAGVVLGVVGIIVCSIYAASFVNAVDQAVTNPAPGGAPAIGSSDPAAGPLVLEVTGSMDEASVTYSNETGGTQTSTVTLPWRMEVPDPGGLRGITLSATPDLGSDGGQLDCKITQGQRTVATQTADGDFASVFCTG